MRSRVLPAPHAALAILAALLLAACQGAASAAEIAGRVVAIADGDTLTVLDGQNRQVRVRLAGIDTPERGKLLAAKHGITEMARLIGADSLAFVSLDGLYRALGRDMVFTTESNELHRRRRAPINNFFSRRSVLELEDVVQATATAMCDRIAADTKDGGSIDSVDIWGRRRLAYDIKKKSEGIYAVIQMTAEPATALELDRQLNLNEVVMRTKLLRPGA